MERKNTILLTVIAIATLLVAVVGATFAYFTATLTTQHDTTDDRQVNVKASTLTSVSFDYGDKVTAKSPVYPGYQIVKPLHVKGSGNDDALTTSVKVDITGSIGENMASDGHVKITVYKGSTKTGDEVTFTSVPKETVESGSAEGGSATSTAKYQDDGSLNTGNAQAIDNGTWTISNQSINQTFTINDIGHDTDVYYYVVVEYVNDKEGQQNDEQGESIEVNIAASLVA